MNDCHMYMIQDDKVVGFLDGTLSYTLERDDLSSRSRTYIKRCDRMYIMSEHQNIYNLSLNKGFLFDILIEYDGHQELLFKNCYLNDVDMSKFITKNSIVIIDHPHIMVDGEVYAEISPA
jgi:hypothetical protein